jgi:hypothetical protein
MQLVAVQLPLLLPTGRHSAAQQGPQFQGLMCDKKARLMKGRHQCLVEWTVWQALAT